MIGRAAVLLFVAAITIAASAEEKGAGPGEAEVTADKLSVDHQKRAARFEGNVRARFEKLTLTCHAMSLQYDDGGEVIRLSASGGVTVTQADVRATARAVRLDVKTGRLVLTGDPVLIKGPHRLTGERIEVDLASGQLSVQAARGRFRLSGRGD